MGIGDPRGLLEVIARGVDIFDCVLPTRTARMGTAFTRRGSLNLRNAEHALSSEPLEARLSVHCLRQFLSRGLYGIFVMQKEILGLALLTEHNLVHVMRVVAARPEAIVDGRFAAFRREYDRAW